VVAADRFTMKELQMLRMTMIRAGACIVCCGTLGWEQALSTQPNVVPQDKKTQIVSQAKRIGWIISGFRTKENEWVVDWLPKNRMIAARHKRLTLHFDANGFFRSLSSVALQNRARKGASGAISRSKEYWFQKTAVLMGKVWPEGRFSRHSLEFNEVKKVRDGIWQPYSNTVSVKMNSSFDATGQRRITAIFALEDGRCLVLGSSHTFHSVR
jgi:hypothetical protein